MTFFKNSLATAVGSGDWNAPEICAIFKKGDPGDVVNNHPVSLTLVACKIFERILRRAILSFPIQYKALTGCQRGFLSHRSSLSNILILEETIARLMDDGNTADVVHLDFAKPFDSGNHRFLLAKLESFGLCDEIVRLIKI